MQFKPGPKTVYKLELVTWMREADWRSLQRGPGAEPLIRWSETKSPEAERFYRWHTAKSAIKLWSQNWQPSLHFANCSLTGKPYKAITLITAVIFALIHRLYPLLPPKNASWKWYWQFLIRLPAILGPVPSHICSVTRTVTKMHLPFITELFSFLSFLPSLFAP